MAQKKLVMQLQEVGSKLQSLPSPADSLLNLLTQAASCLTEMEQSPPAIVMESMQPFMNAIVKPELLKHQDMDVKLLVASCICEITRITAPVAPYGDDVLKDIFNLIVGTFDGLSDTGDPLFGRRVAILETLAKYRSCVVMLDLECDDLVNKMFSTFFTVASDDHQESVLSSMQTIMVVLIEESEDVQEHLILVLLSALGRNKSVSATARRLAMNVIEQSAGKLEASIKQFLISSISGDNMLTNSRIDYHEAIYDIYRCAPQILTGVVPYLTGELLTDQQDTRLKAVGLVGDLFALPGSIDTEVFRPIFSEFLKRLTDRVIEVRMSVLEHVKSFLLSNPSQAEATQIISALCDGLLDHDENVRKQVVDVICDVACHSRNPIPVESIKLVAERLRDKSLFVKRCTMERLADIFRAYCGKSSDGSIDHSEFDWIPGKILRCLYDQDFRSDNIEHVLCESLFPTDFSVKERVKHWVRIFSAFEKVEVKALEMILEQKQRLQQEMLKYLSLRQVHQDGDGPEIQKKILFCFRFMSRSFADPAKAEESFQRLDQLKDADIWKTLTSLLDPNTISHQACSGRDGLLKILGEKHHLYDFLSNLSLKCSYLLFNKEHVKEILLEVALHKSTGNAHFTQSCMDIMVIIGHFSPLLLGGVEEELISLLKDDNEIIKEGALHVLASAGGTIREQLASSSSSIDLILERFCLEGNRKQAKYAVHALAAITMDDGLKSLSVLYKNLVDMLEEKRHLPAVLQSLGCIAETAMPVFETRESEIEEFIKSKILECSSSKEEDNRNKIWDNRSELCLLKIYGIKTLVKSYLPIKDAQLRPGIDNLLQILRNILSFGEISKDIESSSVDKAHLRLASAKAVLRLSRQWDHNIPIDVFHLTLRTPESTFPQAKRIFLSKVHQYIKENLLDAKYACAFVFNITGSDFLDFEKEKQIFTDIIQLHYQAKAQLSVQSDSNPVSTYPEYMLPYLVHTLAHHLCPNIEECKDVKAFEPIYRQLYFFLSILMHEDEDAKLDTIINKERISTIVTIFKNIKCSEDVVDAAKSKNSHAIAGLGLSITKRLGQKDDDCQTLTSTVSLPTVLYKPYEMREGDESLENKGKTWFDDESVTAHFNSLKLENNEKLVGSVVVKDEVLKESDGEANEVPLGKMLKQLKSQGGKGGKTKKDNSSMANTKVAESDVDILKVVREINLDNLGLASRFESSNGDKHSPDEETKSELEHQKVEKRKFSAVTSVPVPKRRRSSSGNSSFRKASSRVPVDYSSPDSKGKMSVPKDMVESSKSDLMPSTQKNGSFASDHKGKDTDLDNDGKKSDVEESDEDNLLKRNVLVTDKKNTSTNFKSLSGSNKKRKRKSITGLAKCTTKESDVDIEELIGYRIKVWWPMDKQFYEGTIKSYDPMKRKHVILYDDGDVEVLRLDKERWELVHKGRKTTKKLKSPMRPLSTEVFPAHKSRGSGSSLQIKESPNIPKGKRTPKKSSKHVKKESKEKGDSDVSNPEHPELSEGESTRQGDSQGRNTERVSKNLTDSKDADKELTSTSKEKQLEDTAGSLNKSEESDREAKSDFKADVSGDRGSTPHHNKKGDVGEESHLEEREDDLNDISKREAKTNSNSEGNQNADVENTCRDVKKPHTKSSNLSDSADAEFSDNEPLSKWKPKVEKSASRRAS